MESHNQWSTGATPSLVLGVALGDDQGMVQCQEANWGFEHAKYVLSLLSFSPAPNESDSCHIVSLIKIGLHFFYNVCKTILYYFIFLARGCSRLEVTSFPCKKNLIHLYLALFFFSLIFYLFVFGFWSTPGTLRGYS